MSRLDFQRRWAIGTILNIGCGDDPANFGARATHLDIDHWNLPNFVHGDCHALPFPDGAFDTAVLGDVLEHCTDPEQAAREAGRIARRVIMTIPEEVLLPSVGQHVQLGIQMRADHYRKVFGYADSMSNDDVIDAHKKTDARFVRSTPESVIAHDGHINRFDDYAVRALCRATGKHNRLVYEKVPESAWFNWLIVLE